MQYNALKGPDDDQHGDGQVMRPYRLTGRRA